MLYFPKEKIGQQTSDSNEMTETQRKMSPFNSWLSDVRVAMDYGFGNAFEVSYVFIDSVYYILTLSKTLWYHPGVADLLPHDSDEVADLILFSFCDKIYDEDQMERVAQRLENMDAQVLGATYRGTVIRKLRELGYVRYVCKGEEVHAD